MPLQRPAAPISTSLLRVGRPSTWQRLPDAMLSRQAIVDMFTRPAMLIDGRRALHGTNRAADRQLAAAQWVSQKQGHLACPEADSEARLSALIAELLMAGQMGLTAPARWLRLDDAPHVGVMPATLALLTADSRRPGEALILLTLHDPDYGHHVDARMLEELFEMTPAEARVACALVRGLSPRQTAELCGVALGTVRTQLKAVFSKTRTRRQAELVRLLIGLSPA
ncbi:MAG TPA: hypothetical protein PKA20_18405 [Burkholderiaceae bacterium]|nr:hypothetical protein [Burkholderiaceae bacterium]